MISFFITFLLALYARYQKNSYIGFLLLPSIFFYCLAYELRNSPLAYDYFEFASVQSYTAYIYFGIFQIIAIAIAITPKICGRFSCTQVPSIIPPILTRRAVKIYYTLSLTSILAFIFNISNVGFDISLLFSDPREYEETFGSSTLINYLYFLNVPALCLSIYIHQIKERTKKSYLIDIILVFIAFFHGIKFTVFDTLLLPAFFYLHCCRQPKKAVWLLAKILVILLAFYLIFSFMVRGVANEAVSPLIAILNYILPNYYNMAYGLTLNPLQFDPLSIFLPDKIPNPILPLLSPGEYGFLLNEKYNMATGYISIYSFLPPFSWVLFIPLLIKTRNWIAKKSKHHQTLKYIFISAYIDFSLFFFWYFYAFNKTKYIFYIIVILLIGYFIRYRKNKDHLQLKP